jgi:hypothetical protein
LKPRFRMETVGKITKEFCEKESSAPSNSLDKPQLNLLVDFIV